MAAAPRRRMQAGMTLIEIVFAAALLGLLMALTSMAVHSTMLGAQSTNVHAGLDNKAAAIVDLLSKELKDGGTKYPNFSIGTSQQSITFARSIGCAAGKPVFGNPITYAVVKYGEKTCLERTEVVNGVALKQILTDQLVPTPVTVMTAQGVPVAVTGINFQMLSADTVTIAIAVQQAHSLLRENSVTADNTMVVTALASVQMLND